MDQTKGMCIDELAVALQKHRWQMKQVPIEY